MCSFLRNVLLLCACVGSFGLVARAVTITELQAGSVPDPQGVMVNGLPYRLFIPAGYDRTKSYPLVIFLHGAGERGVDNVRQGANGGLMWAQPQVQEKHPCFVLLPQCPQSLDAFQVINTYNHPCGIHDCGVANPPVGATVRAQLPLGRFLRGKRTTMVFLTDPARKDAPVELSFSNFRVSVAGKDEGPYLNFKGQALAPLTERFYMTPEGCYCSEQPMQEQAKQPAMESSVSDDGLAIHLKSAPGVPLRLGIACPLEIAKDTVLYYDLRVTAAGSGQRLGFLIGDRIPEYRWVNTDWGLKTPEPMPAAPSAPMRLLLSLLDSLQQQYSIDHDRVYVTGLSMGGYGTWDIIARRPDLFAAAIPICGGGDPATAPKIAALPLWIFHGGADNVVPTVRARLMVEALKNAGGAPRYTEYPGVDHYSWGKAYAEPELVEWLFTQTRAKR